jgi:Domain of unknown function (DUF4189)
MPNRLWAQSRRWCSLLLAIDATEEDIAESAMGGPVDSVAAAKNAALRACRDSGGSDHCKVHLSYFDQCVAYAIGDDYSVGVARSPMPEEAN